MTGAVGFWSYAHDDNRSTADGILTLARSIAAEYDVLTGEGLRVFVDRDAIEWGDNWRDRIDSGLSDATFFIPVVTRRYFNRPECRREFVRFSAQARSRGLADYILPILYAPVPDLAEDNPDELKATVARTQYVDWSKLRLADPTSATYREAVHRLASRLVEIGDRLATVQVRNEEAEVGGGGDGAVELVAKIEALIPDWLDAVIANRTVMAQLRGTADAHVQELARLGGKRGGTSSVTASKLRLARESLPLQLRLQSLATVYSARSIELDPLVTELLRIASDHPDVLDVMGSLPEAIDEAMENIARHDRTADGTPDFFRDNLHLGQVFKELDRSYREFRKLVDEGNGIVERWAARLRELRGAAVP